MGTTVTFLPVELRRFVGSAAAGIAAVSLWALLDPAVGMAPWALALEALPVIGALVVVFRLRSEVDATGIRHRGVDARYAVPWCDVESLAAAPPGPRLLNPHRSLDVTVRGAAPRPLRLIGRVRFAASSPASGDPVDAVVAMYAGHRAECPRCGTPAPLSPA